MAPDGRRDLDHADVRFCELEAEIRRLEVKQQAYDADDVFRGGAFVILRHDGDLRIERGFIRLTSRDRSRSRLVMPRSRWRTKGADDEAAEGGKGE